MPEQLFSIDQYSVGEEASTATNCFPPRRQETLNVSAVHEERLEWVRKSCERFFEKVREFDALIVCPELN
jgi:hypothetical protein